jgi:hypothetical protein
MDQSPPSQPLVTPNSTTINATYAILRTDPDPMCISFIPALPLDGPEDRGAVAAFQIDSIIAPMATITTTNNTISKSRATIFPRAANIGAT